MLGAVGLAVDLGNHRATNSRTTTAADSAALAAAQELSDGATETAASGVAQARVTANEPNAGDSGRQRGPPLGICMEALGTLLSTWDPLGASSIGPITVPYGKGSQPAACSGGNAVPGNWGSLDFDGGSNSNADQKDRIENGYDGTVYPNEPIDGNTGAISNSLSSAMDSLILSGEVFPVPLFGSVGGGSGSNATFTIIGFVSAQLTGYEVTGSAASRELEFVFHPGQWPGVPCCDMTATSIDLSASGICATSDETDAC